MNTRQRRVHSRDRNRGAVAVEAALCLLAMVPIMLGTLEVCAGYYLQESITIAAYEGARTAARQDATPDGVKQYVRSILEDRGVNISDGNIAVAPTSFANHRALDPVTVTISCPTEGNSIFVFEHMASRTLTASVSFAFEVGLPPLNLNN